MTSSWSPFFYKTFAGYSSLLSLWEPIAAQFQSHWPLPDDFNRLAKENNLNDLSFIQQDVQMNYETMIYSQRQIPMRLNLWHDFFNNLTWLCFPKIKWAITTRYLKEKHLEKRTPRQNLLAHFDECGMVICCSKPDYFDKVRQFQWKSFFCETPDIIQVCEPFIIGHGLLEKCLSPYVGITGKALFLTVEQSFFALTLKDKLQYIDRTIADYIASDMFPALPRSLHPFPFLGWPGWYEENLSKDFYNNQDYFRPLKNHRRSLV